MSASTVGHLIDRTFDLLLGSERGELNQLVADIDASATSFNVYTPPPPDKTFISIDDELLYVRTKTDRSGTSSSVNVIRGMKGTTAASHSADALIYVNPFFTRYQVRETLRDEIRSWAPQIFSVKTVDLTTADCVRGYDLGEIDPFLGVLDVRESPGWESSKSWRSVPFTVEHSGNTTDFPSGNVLRIADPHGVPTGRTLHVSYAVPFDVDTSFADDDDLTDMGLDTSDLDIPQYGAAWRLAASREIRRLLTEAMGDSADLQAHPPGYAISAADKFKSLRDARLADAAERLRTMYPLMRRAA